MKLHPSLVEAIVDTLLHIFVHGVYADKAIEKKLKSNKKWGSRDRGFIAENTYNIVRWWQLLHYLLSGKSSLPDSTILTENYFHDLLGVWLFKKELLTQDQLFLYKNIDFEAVKERLQQLSIQTNSIQNSIPDWLDIIAQQELGEGWANLSTALNEPAPVVLRVNTLLTNRNTLQQLLHREGIDTMTHHEVSTALILTKKANVFSTKAFKDGWFEVQDIASQMVAELLDVESGMKVVDACAGAGGKTLHLAALLLNKGKVIALDTEAFKLETLKQRAKRAKAFNIETRPIENSKTIKRLTETADRLLLDVPCSGLGVLRRNPDTKWKLRPEFLDEIRVVQADILERYSKILRPNGKMVYATCSILPSENQNQVEKFLAQHPDFELLEQKTLYPHLHQTDGFFMALMQRKK